MTCLNNNDCFGYLFFNTDSKTTILLAKFQMRGVLVLLEMGER